MALNKYMHPRNIYKTPPDFSKLSEKYPEFASVVKKDVIGKVCIDFKDPKSLRILTKCLLKSDFDLDVEIPEDRLVPTLPLRLNYILWIEDLLECFEIKDVLGLDIGTGACAVYPLLAAVKNKWHMVGTETDEESCIRAQSNVKRNYLQELVTVLKNPSKAIVEFVFKESEDKRFSFCMCNPPFYSSVQELCESRSIARPPPKNAFTGSPQELITEGGELEFIRTLISESKRFPNNICIYSTMVGHKYNLTELLQDLKTENIQHTHTEFCQGRVTRWGLAWTLQQYNFDKIAPVNDKSRKKTAISFLVPALPNVVYEVQTALDKLKELFKKLKINYKILNKRGTTFLLEIIAKENTWTNQRRKRRLMKQRETELAKKHKLENGSGINKYNNNKQQETDQANTPKKEIGSKNNEDYEKQNLETEQVNTPKLKNASGNNEYDNKKELESDQAVTLKLKKSLGNNEDDNKKQLDTEQTKKPKLENGSGNNEDDNKNAVTSKLIESISNKKDQIDCNAYTTSNSTNSKNTKVETCSDNKSKELDAPLVQAHIKLFKKEEKIFFEMDFISGSSGKEGLHQILQYIKNNWK